MSSSVSLLVDEELEKNSDHDLLERIRPLLAIPYVVDRDWDWDYGDLDEKFPCWIVLEHLPSNTRIAYCEFGIGPSHPRGLVALTGAYTGMGMDSSGYQTLDDVDRESCVTVSV